MNRFLTVAGIAALTLPLAAADCLGNGGVAFECETDEDCASADNPDPNNSVCDTTGAVGVCVSPDGGEGEGEGEGEVDECATIDDAVCLDDELLCDLEVSPTICADPDVVTGACAAAELFTGTRDAGGPIAYGVELEADPDLDDTCIDGNGNPLGDYHTIAFIVHDPTGDFITTFSAADYEAFLWARSDVAGFTPAPSTLEWVVVPLADGGNAAEDAVVVMPVCFQNPPAQTDIAVQVEDEAGNASNAACGGVGI